MWRGARGHWRPVDAGIETVIATSGWQQGIRLYFSISCPADRLYFFLPPTVDPLSPREQLQFDPPPSLTGNLQLVIEGVSQRIYIINQGV